MALIDPVPPHLRTVTARLVVRDAAAAIDCYRTAFDARVFGEPFIAPDGTVIHVELSIGDAVVMLTDEGADPDAPAQSPQSLGSVTAIMATYWPNVDAAWERALAADFEVVFPLADQFYGDRAGRLRDPYGHQWMLSQRIKDVSPAELGAS